MEGSSQRLCDRACGDARRRGATGPWWAVAMVLMCPSPATSASVGPTYYVSPTGSDLADGLSPETAWRSVAKVSGTMFDPGTQILFERGGEWREQLTATSSGTIDAPIVYGAYGDGAKPKLWGSDVLSNHAFSPVEGTANTYRIASAATINSVLIDQQFMRSASLLSRSSDPAANIHYVKTNPNTWYYDGSDLYVNTGGSDPRSDNRLYTGAVRDLVVTSTAKSHLVFRDFVVDESAKFGGGWGFGFGQGTNILLENAESYRAGKHHFGTVNVNDFVGRNLVAADTMPDQGIGGSTAYVSYSCCGPRGDSASWIDISYQQPNGNYPAFLIHGEGLGDVLVQNIVATDAGIGIGDESETTRVRIVGGTLHNGQVAVRGAGTIIDGLTITGPKGAIIVNGDRNVVMNTTILGSRGDVVGRAAIGDFGRHNDFLFNTIVMDPTSHPASAGFHIDHFNSRSDFFGNLVITRAVAIDYEFNQGGVFRSDYNLFNQGSFAFTNRTLTFEEMQSFGPEAQSMMGPLTYNAATGQVLWMGQPAQLFIDVQAVQDRLASPRVLLPWPIGDQVDPDLTNWPLPGDANYDGQVTIYDLATVAAYFGQRHVMSWETGDFNDDGAVTLADLAILSTNFGRIVTVDIFSSGGGADVPEPISLVLAAVAGCILRPRRQASRRIVC